jgi:glycolate oxidase iron-sulfur subunit
LGDELDGPRGRIYLIKQVLEGKPVTDKTRTHLDRCLTCRPCETTCPSGVKYSHLLDVGRQVVEDRLPRRWANADACPASRGIAAAGSVWHGGQAWRGDSALAAIDTGRQAAAGAVGRQAVAEACGHRRRMLALAGCVQPALAPNINAATARVLDKLGIALFEEGRAGCCGAVRFHLNDQAAARPTCGAISTPGGRTSRPVSTPSSLPPPAVVCRFGTTATCWLTTGLCRQGGSGQRTVPRPGRHLAAEKVALLALLESHAAQRGKLAFHSPCTLQHGLKIRGVIEEFLQAAGYRLTPVADGHLCCGSAGTYAVLQPELAVRLRDNKLAALNAGGPEQVATANIGCLTHLQAGSALPVRHWIELIDEVLHERYRQFSV